MKMQITLAALHINGMQKSGKKNKMASDGATEASKHRKLEGSKGYSLTLRRRSLRLRKKKKKEADIGDNNLHVLHG